MKLVEKMLSMKPFKCPRCGQDLPLADVNVGQDVALCRACNYTGSFIAAAAVPKLSDEEMARPPKRVTLQRGFGDELTITCRPRRTALFFLLPFTLFWSGFSMAGIYVVPLLKGSFDLEMALFGLPFLIGSIVLVTIILNVLLGRTTITLAKGKVVVGTHLLGWRRVKEFECGQDTAVSLQASSYSENNVPQSEIVLTSGGREFRFGALALSKEARTYVAAVLRRAAGGG